MPPKDSLARTETKQASTTGIRTLSSEIVKQLQNFAKEKNWPKVLKLFEHGDDLAASHHSELITLFLTDVFLDLKSLGNGNDLAFIFELLPHLPIHLAKNDPLLLKLCNYFLDLTNKANALTPKHIVNILLNLLKLPLDLSEKSIVINVITKAYELLAKNLDQLETEDQVNLIYVTEIIIRAPSPSTRKDASNFTRLLIKLFDKVKETRPDAILENNPELFVRLLHTILIIEKSGSQKLFQKLFQGFWPFFKEIKAVACRKKFTSDLNSEESDLLKELNSLKEQGHIYEYELILDPVSTLKRFCIIANNELLFNIYIVPISDFLSAEPIFTLEAQMRWDVAKITSPQSIFLPEGAISEQPEEIQNHLIRIFANPSFITEIICKKYVGTKLAALSFSNFSEFAETKERKVFPSAPNEVDPSMPPFWVPYTVYYPSMPMLIACTDQSYSHYYALLMYCNFVPVPDASNSDVIRTTITFPGPVSFRPFKHSSDYNKELVQRVRKEREVQDSVYNPTDLPLHTF